MKTLGRNADNDLYIESSSFAIVRDTEAQCAIIESLLLTQQGELQFDDEAGIDYFGTVLLNPNRIELWAANVRTKILALPFVSNIEDFKYKFVPSESALYWSMVVVNTDNEKITLSDRKTNISGSPGIDVSWNDVYDKPDGIDETLEMIEGMHHEAVDVGITLSRSSSLRQAKEIFNRVVFDPNDKEYAKTRSIEFKLTGVPLGTVIDFERLRIDIKNTPKADGSEYYAPFLIEISDGTRFYSSATQPETHATDNIVLFMADDGSKTPFHTIMKGGDVSITFKGNITGIKSSDKDGEGPYPVFLDATGTKPFKYVTGLNVGSRVPLENVGNYSFYGFCNLHDIEWDDSSATSISFGDYSFSGCSSLWNLQWIPKKTNAIGTGCFSGCTNITSLNGFEHITFEASGYKIPDRCFAGCSQLTSLEYINQAITQIGERAFQNCVSLMSLESLPTTIETIGEGAFKGCTAITSILSLPNNLSVIGAEAFAECTALESVYVPETVREIGDGAFSGCSALSDIMIEAGWEEDGQPKVPEVSDGTFPEQEISIFVPAAYKQAYVNSWPSRLKIYKYGVYTFNLEKVSSGLTLAGNSGKLESDSIWVISFGDGDEEKRFLKSVGNLPDYTYSNSHSTCSVVIKGYVRRIYSNETDYPFLSSASDDTFDYLKGISVSDSPLEMVGDYAFAQCTKLSSVDFGFEEKRDYCLGDRAFWGCASLKSLSWIKDGIGELVQEVRYTYEEGEDGNPVRVEEKVYYPPFGEGCFLQSGITSLNYQVQNITDHFTGLSAYCFSETAIINLNGIGGNYLSSLGEHCFDGCESLTSISALSGTGITTLPDYCFANCSALDSLDGIQNLVIKPSSEESEYKFGSHVFENCTSLASIALIGASDGIEAIADYMFAGCTGLTSLVGITNNVKELGQGSFSGCSNITSLRPLNAATKITTIPESCFAGCTGLTTLIGCYNIQNIEESAFANCYETYTEEGTVKSRGLLSTSGLGPSIVSIADYAFANCNLLQYVSIVSETVPSLSGTAFDGVQVSGIPLYVREGLELSFGSASGWSSFITQTHRTIKIVLNNITELSVADAASTYVKAEVGNGVNGVWYADLDDGNPFRIFYAEDDESDFINIENAIEYDPDSALIQKTISLFGDIVEIGTRANDEKLVIADNIESGNVPEFSSFLGTNAAHASSIVIESPYLANIGDGCFYNYGWQNQSGSTGNNNSLFVSISMSGAGEIGKFAFAKDVNHKTGGIIGDLGSFTASTVGRYAFYQAGLSSSSKFSSLTSVKEGAFAENPDIPDLSGFGGIRNVPDKLFENCSGLTSTSGLLDIESIGASAFSGCANLEEVNGLGSELDEIGDSAFAGCEKIKTIIVTNPNPPLLAEDGFSGTTFDTAIVYVPAGSETKYKDPNYKGETWGADDSNQWYLFGDRIVSLAIKFTFDNVIAGDRIAEGMATVVASGDWTISYGENGGFRDFPAGTTVLPSYTFSDSGDHTILISGAVTRISCTSSAYPFMGQSKGVNKWLTRIEATDLVELEEIGPYTFAGCSNLVEVKNFPSVKSIGERAFENNAALKEIDGFSGVETIGEYAFSGCPSLESLYGLSSVKTIGTRAFNGCSSLKFIDGLGDSIAEIGDYAFASCALKEVQVFADTPPSIGDNTFSGIDKDKVILYVRSRYLDAYKNSVAWGNVFSNVRSRYIEMSLAACPSNTKIEDEYGVVNSSTYWVVDWDSSSYDGIGCKAGLDTYLPAHTYDISGNHSFRLEGGITRISAKKTSEKIDIDYEDLGAKHTSVNRIEGYKGSFITLSVSGSQTAPDNETYVAKCLTKVAGSQYAPLETIGDCSFISNKALSVVNMAGVKEIGVAAFAYCTSLTNTDMLQSVTKIGECAFYGCVGVTDITNMNSLAEGTTDNPSIDTFAFGGMTNLHSIQCGVETPPVLSENNQPFGYFENIAAQRAISLYVPLNSVSSYIAAPVWGDFTVASQVVRFVMEDVPSGTTIVGISGENSVGSGRVEIADGSTGNWYMDWGDGTERAVMTYHDTSFPSHTYEYVAGADNASAWYSKTIDGTESWFLRSVTIQLSGNIAAIACQTATNKPFLAVAGNEGNPYLTSVEASEYLDNLTVIGDYAFQNCTALTKAVGFKNVVSIGQYAFQNCGNLIDLGNDETGFKNATSIGNGAFMGCVSLQNLVAFPSALKLGIRAFADCTGLVETTGLGASYVGVPYYTEYEPTLVKGTDISGYAGYEVGKQTYTIGELTSVVTRVEGWKTIRQLTTNEEGKITDITWIDNINLPLSFGSYAFENCTFSSINMESYEMPPSIQGTTFTVDPSKTLVYVPAATEYVDPIEKYQQAPGWMPFFDNIIAASSLELEFYPGRIHGNTHIPTTDETTAGQYDDATGVAIFGMGKVTFTNSTFTIDWGDGTVAQEVTGETTYTTSDGESIYAAAFPSHIYPAAFQPSPTYSVSIRLRGSITGVEGTEQEDGTYKPLFAVAPVTKHYVKDADNNWSLSSATIEETELQYDALRSVSIGGNSKISALGDGCFYGFTDPDRTLGSSGNGYGLKNVVFKVSSGVTESPLKRIGDKAFYNCSALDSFKNNLGMVSNDSSVGNFAFYGCSNLHDSLDFGALEFISGCGTIGNGAFQNCIGLTDIELPSTLTSVGESAFEGCLNVKGIEWGTGDSSANGSIGSRAFYKCSGNDDLNWDISIPSQIKTIGASAFYGCGMKTFTWGDDGSSISGSLMAGVPGIFEGCTNLNEVSIHATVQSIPNRCFCLCKNLETISIEDGCETIGAYAFFGCEALTGSSFGNVCKNVVNPIGAYAFARCMSLGSITIPATVNELGEGCFSRSAEDFYTGDSWNPQAESSSVTRFYTLAEFEDFMTASYLNKRMDVWAEYDSLVTNPDSNDGSSNSCEITWEWGSQSPRPLRSIGKGCFMNNVGLALVWDGFSTLNRLPEYCFFNCQSMFDGTNLSQLPDGLTSLGRFALAKTGMTSVSRSSGIAASLAPGLFMGCTKLTSLDGLKNLFSTVPSAIPDACFYGCSNLKDINVFSTYLTNVVNIGAYAFAYCNLDFGNGDYSISVALYYVKQIGDGSFMGNTGNTGGSVFYGLPKVKYYPYLSFYGCTRMTQIMQFYSAAETDDSAASDSSWGIPDVEVTLEGDSFGGISGITAISLPYSSYVVSVVSAGNYPIIPGEEYPRPINDPFSGIQNKSTVSLTVPNEIVSAYLEDSYWKNFHIGTSFDGLPLAMSISMDVPNTNNATINGYGNIKVNTSLGHGLAIEWGDGDSWIQTQIPEDGIFNISSISHTYAPLENAGMTHPVTMKIYGDVTSFEGAADNVTSSVLANKTVVPFFYTHVSNTTGSGSPRIAENTWFRSVLFYAAQLTTIGDGAFGYCTQMLPPAIPSTVTTLGNNAFFGCDQIRDLDFIPEVSGNKHNITTIGQYCFAYCDNLTNYSGFARLKGLEAIPAGCFAKTKSVPVEDNEVLDWLPTSIRNIGFSAFQHVCFKYFDLDTTNAITIGNYAFRYNTSLINFTKNGVTGTSGIQMNLTGTNAFRECTALSSLNGFLLKSTNNTIPEGTFRGCSSLQDISAIHSNTQIKVIRDAAFYGTAITSLSNLPTELTTIGTVPAPHYDLNFERNSGGAFEGCNHLNSLSGMPSTVSSIGTASFKGCPLGDLTGMSSQVTSLGEYCFSRCSMMEDTDGMSSGITVLPEGCFIGCSGLTSISLPESILEIGVKCFVDSISLNSITIAAENVITLDDNPTSSVALNVFPYAVLNSNSNFHIYVPQVSVSEYQAEWGTNGRFDSAKIVQAT